MKKVIISGAAGFIGNAVARLMIQQNVHVTAVVKPGTYQSFESFRLKNFDADIIECDLRNIEALPEMIHDKGYDAFYQFAWDGTSTNELLDYNTQINNIVWTLNSITAASALKCRKFIGAGSITQSELLYSEGRFYTSDKHKYFRVAQDASETMGRALAKDYGIEFIWPIIINVYGEGEISARLINSMITNLLHKKYQSFSSGEQLYDFVHIEDAARAFYLIGEKGCERSRYTIGSGQPKPLKEYLEIIRDIIASDMKLGLGDLEFNGLKMEKSTFSIDTLTHDTGFIPKISFENGIKRTYEWIKGAKINV